MWQCSYCKFIITHESYLGLAYNIGCPRCHNSLSDFIPCNLAVIIDFWSVIDLCKWAAKIFNDYQQRKVKIRPLITVCDPKHSLNDIEIEQITELGLGISDLSVDDYVKMTPSVKISYEN